MMAKAAPAHFPYLDHRTVDEIERDKVTEAILKSLGR